MADLVVVKAEEKLGAGTSMEYVIAKYFGKPVITVIPKDSHHRRSNLYFADVLVVDWIHPFVASMSDFVVEKIEDVEGIKNKVLKQTPKDITYIDEAIAHAEGLGID
jgi:hypothetical protein